MKSHHLSLLLILFLMAPPWPTQAQSGDCWIAYHSDQTGDWEVFAWGALPDGRSPNLSQGPGPNVFDLYPTRAPDGSGIIFASTRDGNWELYRANITGGEPERLTFNDSSIDIDPNWSPDGGGVVYDSNVDGNWELRYINLATGFSEGLTDHPANDVSADWRPDSGGLAFQSDRADGLWQIYALELGGGEVTRLSDGRADDFDPAYAPNGEAIAFRSTRDWPDGTRTSIYLMAPDGGDLRLISAAGSHALNVAWSADGDLLAYQMDGGGDGVYDVYVYQASTGQTRRLTDNGPVNDVSPTWYCDSDTLVFTSDAGGSNDLYTLPALPMEAPPADVLTEAARLTFEPSNQRDAVGYPNDENASRAEANPPKWGGD
jgi:TolB protein